MRLYSAFEAELTVLNRSDHKPIFGGPVHSEVCTSNLLAEFECFLYDTEQLLLVGGVDIEKLLTEYGPGQLEFVLKPQYGIESADTMFRLRAGVKEICQQKGWLATFMAQVRVTVVIPNYQFVGVNYFTAFHDACQVVPIHGVERYSAGQTTLCLDLTAAQKRLASHFVGHLSSQ